MKPALHALLSFSSPQKCFSNWAFTARGPRSNLSLWPQKFLMFEAFTAFLHEIRLAFFSFLFFFSYHFWAARCEVQGPVWVTPPSLSSLLLLLKPFPTPIQKYHRTWIFSLLCSALVFARISSPSALFTGDPHCTAYSHTNQIYPAEPRFHVDNLSLKVLQKTDNFHWKCFFECISQFAFGAGA